MAYTVFFSWQLDTPSKEGRNLIEGAIERALKSIKSDMTIEQPVRDLSVTSDARDIPGWAALVDSLLEKIEGAAIFVLDLTFVAMRRDGRPAPNPNVLIEYGYALKSLGSRRIVAVMNSAFGVPSAETLPFDVQHLLHPIQYCCPDDAPDSERASIRDALSKKLIRAFRLILEDPKFLEATKPLVPNQAHPHDLALLSKVREIFSPSVQTFLGRHHFRTPFRVNQISPLHDMADYWVGPAYRFHDAQVQEAFGSVIAANVCLTNLVGERIYSDDKSLGIGTPLTNLDRAQGITETTRNGIRELNQAAADLLSAIDKFEDVARTRLQA